MGRPGLIAVIIASAALASCGDDDSQPAPADAGVDAGCATGSVRVPTAAGVALQVSERGCGPAIVLLHGFPEFAFTWDPLAELLAADFRLIAPDQRGYAPSDIPADVASYQVTPLVDDAAAVIRARAPGGAVVVAHDWGGIVAWVLASRHPELVRGLVIINAPHPDVFRREVAMSAAQRQASQYMNLFLSTQAEGILSANNYQPLIDGFDGLLSPTDQARYRAAWAQPGTLTGGLNWYRANIAQGPTPGPAVPSDVRITVRTLVLWGTQDRFLLTGNLDGLDSYVSRLTVQRFPNSGHWIVYQEPAALAAAIKPFAAAP